MSIHAPRPTSSRPQPGMLLIAQQLSRFSVHYSGAFPDMPQIELCFWATGKTPAKSLNIDLVICRFTPTSHISRYLIGTVWPHSCWRHRGTFLLENVMQQGKYIYNLERENVRKRVKQNCCVTGKCFPRLAFTVYLCGVLSLLDVVFWTGGILVSFENHGPMERLNDGNMGWCFERQTKLYPRDYEEAH